MSFFPFFLIIHIAILLNVSLDSLTAWLTRGFLRVFPKFSVKNICQTKVRDLLPS